MSALSVMAPTLKHLAISDLERDDENHAHFGFHPIRSDRSIFRSPVIALDASGHLTTDFTALDGLTVAALVGSPQGIAPPRTGWPEAVTRLRLPWNVACGFPALRSSEVDLQRFAAIRSSRRFSNNRIRVRDARWAWQRKPFSRHNDHGTRTGPSQGR